MLLSRKPGRRRDNYGRRLVINYDSPVYFIWHTLGLIYPVLRFQTEKFYDLTGSLTYITVTIYVLYQLVQLNSSIDFRSAIIAACILIWTIRLGSFLFWRVLKDGEDKRFRSILPSFTQLFMTWSLSAAWVFIQLLSALVAITAISKVPFGILGSLGLAVWIFGFVLKLSQINKKPNLNLMQRMKVNS